MSGVTWFCIPISLSVLILVFCAVLAFGFAMDETISRKQSAICILISGVFVIAATMTLFCVVSLASIANGSAHYELRESSNGERKWTRIEEAEGKR